MAGLLDILNPDTEFDKESRSDKPYQERTMPVNVFIGEQVEHKKLLN
jgi:hypothetical protein